MAKMNKKQCALLFLGGCILCLVAILFYNAVDNSLSQLDKLYIPKYLVGVRSLPKAPTYEDEVNFIRSVQHAVLSIVQGNKGIPLGQKREPKELYEAGTGLCFDRSRVIEKILQYSGFDVRHVFILSLEETGSVIQAIMAAGVSTHAVTEVLTAKGWLVVDSNAPWVSIETNGAPVSIERMRYGVGHPAPIRWDREVPSTIYVKPFTFFYGLYSRHGHFYPPYNGIPDVNYGEVLHNIL